MLTWVKRFLWRFRKQTRGIISLFLALTLLPFSSIAILITESARYQNAAELLEEIIDGSAFSTIGDYDSYLEDRFDLLATGQQADVSGNFSKYMKSNIEAIGKNASLVSAQASGDFALSDKDILKAQIKETCGAEVTIEFIEDVADIDELLKKLRESFGGNMEKTVKSMDALQKCADVTKDVAEVVESIKEVFEMEDYYEAVEKDYRDKYTAFEKAVLQIPVEIKKAEEERDKALSEQNNSTEDSSVESTTDGGDVTPSPTPTPKPVEMDPYKYENVKAAIQQADDAADEYKSAASTLKSKFSELAKKLVTMNDKIVGLPKKISSSKESIDKLVSKDAVKSTFDWAEEMSAQAGKLIISGNTDALKNKVAEKENLVSDQIENLRLFNGKDITKSWTHDTLVGKGYTPIDLNIVADNFKTICETVSREMDRLTTTEGDEEDASLGDLLTLAHNIMGINFLYDSNLNALVTDSSLFVQTEMNWNAKIIIGSMQSLVSSASKFADALKKRSSINPLEQLIAVAEGVRALFDVIVAIVQFVAAAVTWVVEAIVGGIELIGNTASDGFMTTLTLAGYAAYNLPNRVTYADGKTLNGYSFSKVFSASGGSYGGDQSGTIAMLESGSINAAASEAGMFRGAETEYVLVGSKNEIENQVASAFNLYMFRLFLNLPNILFGSGDPGSMLSFTNIAGWIIKIVTLLVEPMLDVIILQNGGKQYLMKDRLYLSPKGILALAKDLAEVSDIYGGLKKHINNSVDTKAQESIDPFDDKGQKKDNKTIKKETSALTEVDGLFMMDYTEYLLILLLLMGNNDIILTRLQNIIQMEAGVQEREKNTFSLNKAYTYIKTDVEAKLNPMFNVDGLAENGFYTVKRTQYIGY